MKKSISNHELKFLKQEVGFLSAENIITEEQRINILDRYEVKAGFSFIKILVTIGAILMGLGILGLIASNWASISKSTKLMLIMGGFIGINGIAYRIEERLPKTSRSLNYIGVFIYGAGIFLIGQMFNFGGHFTGAFLLWAVGIIPMAILLRDRLMYIFSILLSLVYVNGHYNIWGRADFPIFMILLLPVLYYGAYRYFKDKSNEIVFLNNLVTLSLILHVLLDLDVDVFFLVATFLIIGLTMYFAKISSNKYVFKFQGSIIFGISGVILTLPNLWNELFSSSTASVVAIGFGIVFAAFLLFLIQKEDLMALLFICIIIFRYYVDIMYDFMPKSLFFIICGLILLGFGLYFEKLRKGKRVIKGGMTHEK